MEKEVIYYIMYKYYNTNNNIEEIISNINSNYNICDAFELDNIIEQNYSLITDEIKEVLYNIINYMLNKQYKEKIYLYDKIYNEDNLDNKNLIIEEVDFKILSILEKYELKTTQFTDKVSKFLEKEIEKLKNLIFNKYIDYKQHNTYVSFEKLISFLLKNNIKKDQIELIIKYNLSSLTEKEKILLNDIVNTLNELSQEKTPSRITDFVFIDQLLDLEPEEAVNYLLENNIEIETISKRMNNIGKNPYEYIIGVTKLKKLRNIINIYYKVIEEKLFNDSLDYCIKLFQISEENKNIDDKLKSIFEIYIHSECINISEFCSKFNIEEKFFNTLINIIKRHAPEYYKKTKKSLDYKLYPNTMLLVRSLAKQIEEQEVLLPNGERRKFDIVDFYDAIKIETNLLLKLKKITLEESFDILCKKEIFEYYKKFRDNIIPCKEYNLLKIDFMQDGKILTLDDKKFIIEYIKNNNYIMCETIFYAIARRYFNGYLLKENIKEKKK